MNQERNLERALHRLRCRICGDVIGVYEPLVVQTAEGVRETSLAAEPHLPHAAQCFHGICFLEAQEPATA